MVKWIKKLKYNKLLAKLGFKPSMRDDEEELLWLGKQWDNKGFQSYIYVRDIEILKSIAEAVRTRDFHTALELSGRRMEILQMADKAKQEVKTSD